MVMAFAKSIAFCLVVTAVVRICWTDEILTFKRNVAQESNIRLRSEIKKDEKQKRWHQVVCNIHNNYGDKICCQGKALRPKSYGNYTQCCGKMAVFHKRTHKCCRDYFVMPRNVSCDLLPCGGKTFDPRLQVCCENTFVFNKTYGMFSKCCGNRIIDSRVKKCCQFTLIHVPLSYSCHPCNDIYYDPTQHVCCAASVLRPKTHGSDTDCCNTHIYNERTQQCCNSSVIDRQTHKCCLDNTIVAVQSSCPSPNFPRCSGRIYSTQTAICCEGKVLHRKRYQHYTMCCGANTIYDPREYHCCKPGNNVISRALPCLVIAKCGGNRYDTVNYICCGNQTLHHKTYGDGTSCCGSKAFDQRHYRCCNNNFVVPLNSSCSYQSSCNGQLYDPFSQICCNGQQLHQRKYNQHTQCCGEAAVYDGRHYICCAASKVVVPKGFSCNPCGNRYYDLRKYICCDQKTILPRLHGSFSRCCGNTVFNTRYYRCCRPQNAIRPKRYACELCGGRNYEPIFSICCGEKVIDRRFHIFQKCCGNSTYDQRYYRCCYNNTVVPFNSSCSYQSSCNGQLYDPLHQICCNGQQLHQRKYNQHTQCCGEAAVYDSRQFHCCAASKVVLLKGFSCTPCGNRYYDLRTHFCCDQKTILPRLHGSFSRCCGNTVFNTRYYRCCRPQNAIRPKRYACELCGGRNYEPIFSICCGEKVIDRRFHIFQKCCGNSTYDQRYYRCCYNNTVVPFNNSCSYQSSCNGQLYDPFSQICCNGQQLHQRKYNQHTQCCGEAAVYDSRHYICCAASKVVVPKGFSCDPCGNRYYDLRKYICCDQKTILPRLHGSFSRCCGNTVFNTRYYRCCRPQNVIRPKRYACELCGGRNYEPIFSICCGEKVIDRRFHIFQKCCGNSTYDQRYYRCCYNNTVVPFNNSCSYQSSCNGQLYDPLRQICCNGQQLHQRKYNQHTQCCGNLTYDQRYYRCCYNNTVIPFNSSCSYQSSCNGHLYNPLRQICCNGQQLHQRKYSQNTRCCGNIVFDVTYYQCCRPRNVILPKGFTCKSCGGQVYHPKFYICCGEKHLHRKPNNFFECCGNSTIYDRRYFKCCPGDPPKLTHNLTCSVQPLARCHGVPYNPSTHICCNNSNIYPKMYNQSTACCTSNKIFDSRTHKCCHAYRITIPESHSCTPCGRTYYDPSRYICCSKKLYHRGHGIYTKCCGANLVYDTRHYRCCPSSRLVHKSAPCPSLSRCNGTIYNSNNYICCGNTHLHPKTYGQGTKCCGAYNVYNATKQKCCLPENLVVPVSKACIICNRKLYNPIIFICCSHSYLYLKKYGSYTGCCGAKTLYDTRSRKCCSDRTVLPVTRSCPTKSFCAGKQYDPLRYICCGGTHLHAKKHGHFTQCCSSSQVYHSRSHKCCSSINKVVLHSYTCVPCNGKLYNPRSALCCSGKYLRAKNFGFNTRCCGNVTYNARRNRCCSPGNKIVSNTFSCITCGGYYYDRSNLVCCGGANLFSRVYGSHTHCCGVAKVYNSRTQQCCHGDIVTGNNAPCYPKLCNGKPYDSSRSICCEDRVLFNRTHGFFTACCGTKKIYHKATHKCCNGSAAVPQLYSCNPCDKRYYDPARLVCCDNINLLYKRFGKHSMCCGRAMYDSRTRTCCSNNGETIPKGSSCNPAYARCGGKVFDDSQFICCNNKAILRRKYGKQTGCCHYGGVYNVYHIYSQRCCFERPIPILQRCQGLDNCEKNLDITKYVCCAGRKVYKEYGFLSHCCGLTVYHPLIQSCCAGAPTPKSGGSAAKCCGQRSYNSEVAKCCAGNHIVAKCESCP